MATLQGDLAAARDMLTECRDYAERAGDELALAYAIHHLGSIVLIGDDPNDAAAMLDDAQRRYDRLGELNSNVVLVRIELAAAALFVGDLDRAAALCEEGRAVSEGHGERWAYAYAVYVLALVSLTRGDLARAVGYGRRCLRIKRSFHDLLGMVLAIEVLAWTAAADGGSERAAILLGVADQMWPSVGYPMFGSRFLGASRHACELSARQALGDEAYDAAVQRGRALDVDAAIAYALGEEARAPAAAGDPDGSPPTPLTPREQEVAELISRGMSNREIAGRLVISQRTAESHVEHILQKLGFGSRVQVAAWSAQQASAATPGSVEG
jgi:ATP/maltotriose-dependent transcriptional regulator MalT